MPTSGYVNEIQGIYIAYYGRWADSSGLAFWTNEVATNGGDFNVMINAFGTSDEYNDTYAAFLDSNGDIIDPSGLINQVYQNLFGRDADSEGLNFYTGHIDSGSLTLAEIALNIFNGAQGEDADLIDSKVAVAKAATEAFIALGDSAAYAGADAIAEARTILADVDASQSSRESALARVNSDNFPPATNGEVSNGEKQEPLPEYIDDIQAVYIAYYGRWADSSGLAFWTNEVANNGGDFNVMINAFGTSDEYNDTYAAFLDSNGDIIDPSGLINQLYQNLFGRDADSEGLNFYTGHIDSGALTLAEIALNILEGAQGEDADLIDSKVAVAKAATEAFIDLGDSAAYAGADAIAEARTILADVDASESSREIALARVNSDNFPPGTNGEISNGEDEVKLGDDFTLTQDVDEIVGTDGNDTFVASIRNSLQSSDSLDGAGGDNVLNILDFAIDSGGAAPTINNVQRINIEGFQEQVGGKLSPLDLTNVTGAEEIWMLGPRALLTNAGLDVIYGIEHTGIVTKTIQLAADVNLSGDADAITFAVRNNHDQTVDFALNDSTGASAESGIEIINLINRGGSGSAVDVTAYTGLETLNLSGEGATTLRVGALNTALETVDAAGYEGDVTFNNTGGLVDNFLSNTGALAIASVTTAGGDDNITIGGSLTAPDVFIDVGAGDDRVSFKLDSTNPNAVTITLGTGNDTIFFEKGTGNINAATSVATNAELEASLVSVTDFNPATDMLFLGITNSPHSFPHYAAHSDIQAAVDAEDPNNLADAVAAAIGAAPDEDNTGATFAYNDNTYIAVDVDGGTNAGIGAGDILIELQGVSAADLNSLLGLPS